jgi:urease accessory protein
MSTPPIRITAADFLTPPELCGYRLADDGAGRIGGVRLELAGGPEHSRLSVCYQQVPLRVLPPFRFADGHPALIYLLNPTAGLMDGDGHSLQITAREGTRGVILGQSATRIHPCLFGFSTQQWSIDLGPGSVLVLLPGPAIPFAGSRYYQRIAINLAPGAAALWGDIWLAGRYGRGEQFRFETFVQELTVHQQGRLVFRDRFGWRGPWDAEQAAWQFGGHPACGSLIIAGPGADRLTQSLVRPGKTCFISAERLGCVRYLGTSEAVTFQLVSDALATAPQFTSNPKGPWLLADHHLGPNHWFSQPANGSCREA